MFLLDRDENPNLRQIVKETGFNIEPIRNNPVLPQYVSGKNNSRFITRNRFASKHSNYETESDN